MAENQNSYTYTLRDDAEKGSVRVADEVIAVIAALAATEVKGVASIAGGIKGPVVARKGIKALSRGVKISVRDGEVTVDLALDLEYGRSIPDVAEKVQEKVKSAIENMTGMPVVAVNLSVADIEVGEGD